MANNKAKVEIYCNGVDHAVPLRGRAFYMGVDERSGDYWTINANTSTEAHNAFDAITNLCGGCGMVGPAGGAYTLTHHRARHFVSSEDVTSPEGGFRGLIVAKSANENPDFFDAKVPEGAVVGRLVQALFKRGVEGKKADGGSQLTLKDCIGTMPARKTSSGEPRFLLLDV